MNSKKYYYYNGEFTITKYYIRTFLVAAALVLMITLGTILMLHFERNFPLVISLVLFAVLLVWYIVYHRPLLKALYSVFVRDNNSLWFITIMAPRDNVYDGSSMPNAGEAIAISKNEKYVGQFIDDIKAGQKRYSIWSGGNQYIKMTDYRIVKTTKKYIFVEALITTRKYRDKRKTLKFVNSYKEIDEIFAM